MKSKTKLAKAGTRTSGKVSTKLPTKADLPPSLASVARVYRGRRELHNQIARDRADRYAAYIKKVENPTEPPGREAIRSFDIKSTRANLRILAEGDSWFDYPYRLEAGVPVPVEDGIITGLEKLLGYPIANMAHFGLELEQMMGLSLRQEIISRLSGGAKFDAMLFSGGGNDLVGDQFCIWFKSTPPAPAPSQLIDLEAVNSIMALLEAEYRELINIRNTYSSETVIFVNSYDYPIVNGKPAICGVGPWMKPGLDYIYHQLGVQKPSPNDEYQVVKALLQEFSKMLSRIAADPHVKNFVVVPTQGTLSPVDSDWQNEIHPTSKGFLKLAAIFKASLGSVFP